MIELLHDTLIGIDLLITIMISERFGLHHVHSLT